MRGRDAVRKAPGHMAFYEMHLIALCYRKRRGLSKNTPVFTCEQRRSRRAFVRAPDVQGATPTTPDTHTVCRFWYASCRSLRILSDPAIFHSARVTTPPWTKEEFGRSLGGAWEELHIERGGLGRGSSICGRDACR